MERAIIEILGDVGYTGPMHEDGRLRKAIEDGVTSKDFTELVAWLSQELKSLCDLDEHITPVTDPEDAEHFMLETSGFLKELGCPYGDLIEGPVNERLKTKAARNALLTYLLSELQSAKMIEANNPESNRSAKPPPVLASPHNDLKNMLLALKFSKPPDNITAAALFTKVETKLAEILKTAHPDLVSKAIFDKPMNPDKWKALVKEQQKLHSEFKIRRELLITRLNVTVQSFEWSDRLKDRQDDMAKEYQNRKSALCKEPAVDISDLLAARLDLSILEKTSNASVRKNTKSGVNDIIIGKVPDRGGRPSEQAAPPKEMPSWQNKRVADAPRGGGGGGGGRGNWRGQNSRGGYVQPNRDNQQMGTSSNYAPQDSYQGHRGGGRGGGSRVQGGWSQQGSDTDRSFYNGGRGRGGNRGGARGDYARGRSRDHF
ncbi:protein FAM98A [Neocloeon triangulifer]|uniref:protein FAM98A n=1 Tax=Neocloeon triangulifer TaxID=2078957 RepID=UPI00286FA6B5|nr:protein FAM98A [Neocloeon triangulifer]